MGVIETGTIVARAGAEAEAEVEAEVRVQVLTAKIIVEQEMMIRAGAGARVGARLGAAPKLPDEKLSDVAPADWFFPLLLSQEALLCPVHLHFPHLMTEPTLETLVAFGFS